jgi:hypothetical protein
MRIRDLRDDNFVLGTKVGEKKRMKIKKIMNPFETFNFEKNDCPVIL